MSRVTSAYAKIVFVSLAACVLAISQAACTPRDGTDPPAGAPDPSAQREIDDNVIKLELNRRLIDDGLGLFKDVSAVVYGGRVLLIGSVDEEETLERAGALAKEINGAREVINEIQVNDAGGIGTFISDVIIEKSIQSGYLFDEAVDSSHFRVRSINGVVYILGEAASRLEYDRAIALASETTDVKRVANYVIIAPD